MNDEQSFWLNSLVNLEKNLNSSKEGLTEKEAKARFKQVGPNLISEHQKRNLLFQFVSRFRSPLVILLVLASIFSFFVGQIQDASIILTIVMFSVLIDFFQEYRAEKAAEKLRKSVALKSIVLREGQKSEIFSSEIVPGDIVFLSAGNLVPADGRLLFANDVFANQALLTGESFPVEKNCNDLTEKEDDLSHATNALFMGSSLVSGQAQMLVCETGSRTFLGGIADVLEKPSPPSAFEIGTRQFGYLLLRITMFLTFFVLIVNLFFHRPFLETVLFALALAVGMTPEFLPMVVSITLARGSIRMSRKKVIVKRLSAIHDLGSMDVLCTDKTGTLTEAHIELAKHLDGNGEESENVLQLSYLNSYFESGIKSTLDQAVLDKKTVSTEGWEKIDEIPFDFERRKISVLLDNGIERLLIVKGAPEDILHSCTHFEGKRVEDLHPLDAQTLQQYEALFEDQSRQGFRVLGIAYRFMPKDYSHAVISDESGLTFAGFATFFDPPKKSSIEALELLTKNNVDLKIVSGDNEFVTSHLCSLLKIPIQGILNGPEISKMSHEALLGSVKKTNLFCRVTPSQKTRIIMALKENGHIVGYMGDGINDAPSLHTAHVAISVDSAVDVAKEAADFILLKRDLKVVNDGVVEGRRTFGNIMKYVMMVTSSNLGNIISMAAASLFIPFLPMLAPQILLNNLLYDVSETPIPLDNVDHEVLKRPHQWSMSLITKFMLILGPISSLFDFLIFYIMLAFLHAGESFFQTGWFIESLATQILVIFVIRTRFSPFKSRPNPILIASSLGMLAIAIMIIYTPLGAYFSFVKLPLYFYYILVPMVCAYLIIAETGKRYFYRRFA
ncbi:MAG: magnesium-translocating P-type ATPase [Alphaproteobacteria bacterium]|nr:magnesium-translocating P-type ATPase [Alphaproteobacteria bacterium]